MIILKDKILKYREEFLFYAKYSLDLDNIEQLKVYNL